MAFDATFWVAVSFIIFCGGLIYLKIPQKITETLDKLISDIKNEPEKSVITLAAYISSISVKTSKKNAKKYAMINLEDSTGVLDLSLIHI